MRVFRKLFCLLALLCAHDAFAHRPGESYLSLKLEETRLVGQWDLSLRDLDAVIDLDENGDGSVTWDELRSRQRAIAAYALGRLRLRVNGVEVTPFVSEHQVASYPDGVYAVVNFEAEGFRKPRALEIEYRVFFDKIPLHRGLVSVAWEGRELVTMFGSANSVQRLDLGDASFWRELRDFGREGVWHIWLGFDHILFLLALLFPSVLRREGAEWRGVAAFKPAFVNVLKVVTAFTVAHSITLSLAALDVVRVPSRIVESVIAASVVLAALNNLKPVVKERVWIVAFCFGLVHGFGFASALSEFGLKDSSLLVPLVGFNLGVEIGQLVIVSLFLPPAFALRDSRFYQSLTLRVGSACVVVLASAWLVQRAFDLPALPF
ncbi:MAG: HupE/UreJ family protein [Verrucomicrobia bacterium]|nr:HupE/UreJ family protein [Verrucomicrobiota bacterium]